MINDRNFKIFFKSNEVAFKRFLISVLHFDFKPEDIKFIFSDKELFDVSSKKHGNVLDFYISINDNIYINVELNENYDEIVKNKLFLYQARQISSSLKVGESYKNFSDIVFIQLNLNTEEGSNVGEEIIMPYNLTTKSIYMTNVITYI